MSREPTRGGPKDSFFSARRVPSFSKSSHDESRNSSYRITSAEKRLSWGTKEWKGSGSSRPRAMSGNDGPWLLSSDRRLLGDVRDHFVRRSSRFRLAPASDFELEDEETVRRAEMDALENALSGRNPEALLAAIAQKEREDAVQVLQLFLSRFVEKNTLRQRARKALETPAMFFAVHGAMVQYLPPLKVITFVEILDVRDRFRLIQQAVEAGDGSTFRKLTEVFLRQGDWGGGEKWRYYRSLLLEAVKLRSIEMFNDIIKLLGGEEEVLAHERRTRRMSGVIHWSIRLLHTASLNGDMEMFNRVSQVFPQTKKKPSLSGKWRLLEGAVNGGRLRTLKRVVQFMGIEDVVFTLDCKPSGGDVHRVTKILRDAIRTKHIGIIDLIFEVFAEAVKILVKRIGSVLLKSAVSTGSLSVFDHVVNIVGKPVVSDAANADGMKLLNSAIRSGDLDVINRVITILESTSPWAKVAAVKHEESILKHAVRSGEVAILNRVVKFLGDEVVGGAADSHDGVLIRAAIASGDVVIVDRAIAILTNASPWTKFMAVRSGESILRSAIRSRNANVVQSLIGFLGGEVAKIASGKGGLSLLTSAVRFRNVAVIKLIAGLLEDPAMMLTGHNGISVLKSAIASCDVAVIDQVVEIMGSKTVKFAAETSGSSVLRSAVRSPDVAVFDRVVGLLGATVVNATSERDGVSLLKSAVAEGSVALVDRVVGLLGDTALKAAVEQSGVALLGSAIRGGDDSFIEGILNILGDSTVKIVVNDEEVSMLRSALDGGDVISVEGVVEVLGNTAVNIETKRNGVELFRSAIRGDNEALVRCVEQIFHKTGADIVEEKDGVSLIRSAIRSRNVAIIDLVVGILGGEVVRNAAEEDKGLLFMSAVRSRDVAVVDRVVSILGDTVLRMATKGISVSLLESALATRDVVIVGRVFELLGEAVLDVSSMDGGLSLMQAALRTGDEVIFRRVVEILGRGVVKGSTRRNSASLLLSAVDSRDVALVNAVVEILGDRAVEAAVKENPYLILSRAIRGTYSLTVRSVSGLFGQTPIGTGGDARRGSSMEPLALSDNQPVVDRVVEMMGEKVVKLVVKERGGALLRDALSDGDVDVVERIVEILGPSAIKGEELALLSFAIQSGDMAFVERMFDILGDMMMTLGVEMLEVALLEDAIRTEDLVSVDRVVDILGDEAVKAVAWKEGGSLLWSAIESRDVALVDRVIDIMGDKAVGAAVRQDGVSLLWSTIHSRDVTMVDRVVEILGESVVSMAAEEDGGSLIRCAIQSRDICLIDSVVDALGDATVRAATEKVGASLLRSAIRGRDVDLLYRVVDILGDAAVETASREDGIPLLGYAIDSRDIFLIEHVLDIIGHTAAEVAADRNGASLLESALSGGHVAFVDRIMDILGDQSVDQAYCKGGGSLLSVALAGGDVAFVEGAEDIVGDTDDPPPRARDYIRNGLNDIASRNMGGVSHFNEVLEILSRKPRGRKFAATFITERVVPPQQQSVMETAVVAGNVEVVEVAMDVINRGLPRAQVMRLCTAAIEQAHAATDVSGRNSDRTLKAVSVMLQFGGNPSKLMRHLVGQGEDYVRKLKDCFLESVCFAPNPFVPGISLSAALDEVARLTPDGERRAPERLRQDVCRLILEILEQLPKTVGACPGKMATCSALFESQGSEGSRLGFTGPLGIALRNRKTMEMLFSRPLVLDFMCQRFNAGSPADNFLHKGVPIEERLLISGQEYYKIPQWRMGFDLVVYVLYVAFFSLEILLHEDEPPSDLERSFIIYIVASLLTEMAEIRRDFRAYSRDHWNVLDFLAISLLTSGWIVRVIDNKSPWGRGLYAVSAPIIFARCLFFAEFLEVQGPMIQVIFSMLKELTQFGIVMVIVMLGFAASFHALFRQSDPPIGYADACLHLFEAMLGEIGFIDDIAEEDNAEAGTFLFVLYLLVMTIMLLNLLIAVLSTAHSHVNQNSVLEYKVSKARVIQHYVLVVENDLLPPPLNLVQLVLSLPFGLVGFLSGRGGVELYRSARRQIGTALFWIVFCPAVIAVGTLKGLLFTRAYETIKAYKTENPWVELSWSNLPYIWPGLFLRIVMASPLVTPVYLTLLWLYGMFNWLVSLVLPMRGGGRSPTSVQSLDQPHHVPKAGFFVEPSYATEKHDVASMLKKSPEGLSVAELQKNLVDPMSDPVVREDEKEQNTRVEHLKLLRDRLENTASSGVQRLGQNMKEVDDRVGELEGVVKALVSKLESFGRKMDWLTQQNESFQEKMASFERKLDETFREFRG